jgi:hypothetical protein
MRFVSWLDEYRLVPLLLVEMALPGTARRVVRAQGMRHQHSRPRRGGKSCREEYGVGVPGTIDFIYVRCGVFVSSFCFVLRVCRSGGMCRAWPFVLPRFLLL